MKNEIYYYFLIIILFGSIKNEKSKKKVIEAFHHLEIKFDYSNIEKNEKKEYLIPLLNQVGNILSKLVLTNNLQKINLTKKKLSKCDKLLSFTSISDLNKDIIIIPVFRKQERNYCLKFCSSNKNNMPQLVILYINQDINIVINNDENSIYKIFLYLLKVLTNSLGLSKSYLKSKFIRNNIFETPDYLMKGYYKTFNSIKKLYNLNGIKMPNKNISLNGNFYKVTWDKNSILKDFRNEEIDIKNDISEASMNLLSDLYFYEISKCEFELIGKNKKCYKVDQKCLDEKKLNSYFLRYGINQKKHNEIICYLSNSDNIKHNQCGTKYSPLINDKINFCPLITKKKIKTHENINNEVPDLKYYDNQTLNLYKPSKKCKNKLRTIYFNSFQREKNITENNNIETIILNKNQRKYFATYLTQTEVYFDMYVKLLKKNGLIRSYYHNNNHNFYVKGFKNEFFLENNKDSKYFNKYQKLYHFMGVETFFYKNLLYRNYLKMKSKFTKDYNYMPLSYEYPKDKEIIEKKFKNYELTANNLWIVKPINLFSGMGIHFFKSLEEENNRKHKNYIISQYIDNPHLINGKKYDMRLYVLVTGFQPLRIYFYQEGILRIAAEKYTLDIKTIGNKYKHLTNTAVNIGHKKFRKPKNTNDENSNEWYLHTYRNYLKRNKINVDSIFDKIKDIIIKTIISGQEKIIKTTSQLKLNDMNMFNLFGFDIIINNNFIPYLLEVNTRPSMASYNNFDKIIKSNLFADTLNIAGITLFSHQKNYRAFDKDIYSNNSIQNMVDNAVCELTRQRGDYELIFPLKKNIDEYKKYFYKGVRLENKLFWEEIKKDEVKP